MLISNAIERFQTESGHTMPFNQLTEIDVLTEFPLIDDPESKMPYLFFGFDGDWIQIKSIITKPYTNALAATNVTDDELNFCREQIEIFHRKYFNLPQISILEDQRKTRIPLVNILRYYAIWNFLAEKIQGDKLSASRVESDFDRIIDATLSRYLILLTTLVNYAKSTSAKCEMQKLFEHLALIQKILDLPAAAITAQHRNALVATLRLCAEIESDIENRIVPELSPQITQLRTSIDNFPANESTEIPLSVFQWNIFGEYETNHADIVQDYCRAARIYDTLIALHSHSENATWNISTNQHYNAAFNSLLLHSAYAHLSVSSPNAKDQEIYGYLFVYNFLHESNYEMLSDLRKVISSAPFAQNPMHQIVLLHLFLPYYINGMQFNRIDHARKRFALAANELHGHIGSLKKYGLDDMRSVSVRLESAWDEWNTPIGIAYQILMHLGNELMLGTTDDGAKLLVAKYGIGREKMVHALSQGHLHQLFSTSAHDIESITRSVFAQKHYEEYGFIASSRLVEPFVTGAAEDERVSPHPKSSADISITTIKNDAMSVGPTGDPSDVPDHIEHQDLLEKEVFRTDVVAEKEHSIHSYFREHSEFTETWQLKWIDIVNNCHLQAAYLIERLAVPKEPSRNHFLERKNIVAEGKTLTGMIANCPLIVPAKEKNAHERYMIGRLVVLGLSIEVPNIDHVAWLCGFRDRVSVRPSGSLPSPANRGRLERYLNTLGLRLEDLSAPLLSKRLNEREKRFLMDMKDRK